MSNKNSNNVCIADSVYYLYDGASDYFKQSIDKIERYDGHVWVTTRKNGKVSFSLDPMFKAASAMHQDGVTFFLNESDAVACSIERHKAEIKKLNEEIQKHQNAINILSK